MTFGNNAFGNNAFGNYAFGIPRFYFFFFEENGVTECESAGYMAGTMTHCKHTLQSRP